MKVSFDNCYIKYTYPNTGHFKLMGQGKWPLIASARPSRSKYHSHLLNESVNLESLYRSKI
jgi:hypothetical protein